MSVLRLVVAACLLSSVGGSALARKGQGQASVVQKVIEMLQENKMKIANDLSGEEAEMAEYAKYCDNEARDRGYAIKTATRKIQDLTAILADGTAQIEGADADIASLGTEIAGKDQDLAKLEKLRKTEKKDFEATEVELQASVEQLEKSLVMIKRSGVGFLQAKGRHQPGQKEMVRQVAKILGTIVNAAWVDQSSSQVLKGFLQSEDTEADEEFSLAHNNQASSEEPAQGGGILQTLEDMKTKAEETLSAARMGEMKANHNYQMMKQSIQAALKTSTTKLDDTQKLKAEVIESNGKASGELADVKRTKVADDMFVEGLQHDCQSAASDWEQRQKDAKGEMAAIDKAVEILANKVKSLVQTNGDFFQGSDGDGDSQTPQRRQLVQSLRDLGHKFNSYALAELAGAAAADPFAKVRKLIEDMIGKLTAEANEEATQKVFCDEEKAKSGKEKEKKSMRADELQNRIDTATSSKASLAESIKELQEEVAKIDSAVREATKIRAEEQGTAMKAAADYKAGASAVTEAVRVLRDYYASVASLAQTSSRIEQPKLGGAKSDAAGAIIAILENCGAEFTKMYMEVNADEDEAKAAFKEEMHKNKVSKSAKQAEIKNAESEIKSLEVSLEENGEDLKMTHKELDAVLGYIDKLKPQCETKSMSFEEKVARRNAEIEGLKEALSILDSQ